MKRLLLLIALLPCLYACTPNEVTPIEEGYGYFPLETKRFSVFDVIETEFTLTQGSTTKRYQIKERLTDAFVGLNRDTTFRVERLKRNTEQESWKLDSVWTARRTTDQAVRTENGVSYLKILFPAREGQRWNGNIFNSFGRDDYEIRKFAQPASINGNAFPETLTVVQQNDSTLVDLNRRTEIYAKNIGLVFQERTQYFYCNSANCLGSGKIDFGKRIIQQIKNHGKE